MIIRLGWGLSIRILEGQFRIHIFQGLATAVLVEKNVLFAKPMRKYLQHIYVLLERKRLRLANGGMAFGTVVGLPNINKIIVLHNNGAD